jgi:uncharacterized glyoxalase superfamily protein PhnB
MAVKPIPEGYHTVTPYLIVKGATDLIKFLKNAFDAKERSVFNNEDGSVAHAEVQIGDSIIMLGEASEKFPEMSIMTYLYVKDVDSVYKKALKAGATSDMAPEDQFYGDRTAGVKDPFGNYWSIGTHIEDVSIEEMKKRMEERMKQNA